ncbi:hypothetical protein KIPB_011883 [Kipferlia bialata]|uniref:Uncharacterized protein n=1 Tax=Kipferlia bialata TaxID=797122 RepID=A0A9K3D8P8_9EUKA|nr:hypothetical protein KIPB_011883 [Kipferlia bialata]|eukprot:g11883.t1
MERARASGEIEDKRKGRAGGRGKPRQADRKSRVWAVVRDLLKKADTGSVDIDTLRTHTIAAGFKTEELDTCLENYSNLGAIFMNTRRDRIRLMDQ